MGKPSIVETDPILPRLYTGLGFESTDSFLLVLGATASADPYSFFGQRRSWEKPRTMLYIMYVMYKTVLAGCAALSGVRRERLGLVLRCPETDHIHLHVTLIHISEPT